MNIASSSINPGKSVGDSQALNARAEQLRAMARQLWLMAGSYDDEASRLLEEAWRNQRNRKADVPLSWEQLSALAADTYQQRRHRDDLFDAHLFGEPAWDMLLDIFVRSIDGRPVRTKEMALASAVPPTTALRWIGQLHEAGLIERRDCTDDRRVHYLTLTAKGMDLMVRCLSAMVNNRDIGSQHSECPNVERPASPSADGLLRSLASVPDAIFELNIPRSCPPSGATSPTLCSPLPLSEKRIALRFPRLGKNGKQLLLRLIQSPGHVVWAEELIAALGGQDHFNKGHVQRGLQQLRMVLIAAGIEKAIARRRGGYVLSPDGAARIMEQFHA